jgi:hypothetical protein
LVRWWLWISSSSSIRELGVGVSFVGVGMDLVDPQRPAQHPDTGVRADPAHPDEPHSGATAGRLNRLRAGVLGANDGIVSVAGIVLGLAKLQGPPPAPLASIPVNVVAGQLRVNR